MKKQVKGISLIILVITIIVVLIIAGAIILSLSQNNPINTATEAAFKASLNEYNSELSLYIASEMTNSNGQFDTNTLNAFTPEALTAIIKGMSLSDAQKFKIIKGKLVTTYDLTTDETSWADSLGIAKEDYVKSDLVFQLDGYDAPQNISGTYYWMDKSGYNNNARMINFLSPASSTTSGYDSITKSYAFDGIDDYIISNSSVSSTKNEYTYELVLKPTEYKYMQISFYAMDFKWRVSPQAPWFNFWSTGNAPNSTSLFTIPTLNNIYSFAAKFNGNSGSVYLNNVIRNSFDRTFTMRNTSNFSTSGEVINGNFYAVRIYNRVLSSDELKHNYDLDVKRFGIVE